ncbi:DUF1642 domain-containing protein [Carnobacterium maltaromaticum]|uniref:DUF1642 domain-containing protein n=1 Tax=Carnobacterium maltaromaticum TaxID=2751 RepID=UPI0039BDCB4E
MMSDDVYFSEWEAGGINKTVELSDDAQPYDELGITKHEEEPHKIYIEASLENSAITVSVHKGTFVRGFYKAIKEFGHLEYLKEIMEGEELTEIKKVVIPKFVAEFLGSHWEDGEPEKEDKADLIRHQEQYIRSFGTSELKNWIVKADNFILFVEAVMNGYEVEKEKLYYVELPEKKETLNARVLKKHPNREIGFGLVDKLDLETATQIRLTEQEIKSIDERYWAFAVEVEGEE